MMMIAVLTLLITLAARSIDLVAKESTDKIPHIGILFIGDRNQAHLEAFKQGLRERGYTEAKYRSPLTAMQRRD
jgi:hypothetical protein